MTATASRARRLYLDPGRLAERLPTLRLLTRPAADIRTCADRLAAAVREAWPDRPVTVQPCHSQIGSGALPVDLLPSFAITIGGNALESLAGSLRALPRPVIGRIAEGRLWLDCRCLQPADEAPFVAQLSESADTRQRKRSGPGGSAGLQSRLGLLGGSG